MKQGKRDQMEKMQDQKKRQLNKDGSALLIAIIIMAVITMVGLVMLLAAYTLHSTVNRQMTVRQNQEIAQSLSKELEEEIEAEVVSSEKLKAIYGDAEDDAALKAAYPLWYYVWKNVWTDSWPCYDNETRGHTKDKAFRYFKFDFNYPETGETGAIAQLREDVDIILYWTLPDELDLNDVQDPTSFENQEDWEKYKEHTMLYIVVTAGKERNKASVSMAYELLYHDGWWQWNYKEEKSST